MDALISLEKSLDNLEEHLKPLLENNLSQTLSKLDLLQQAKLQVLLPYVLNDLIFIYLRTRGLNPKTHPVIGELDRVKQYFDKIQKAEDPEKRKLAVDQAAATRFIKHAIKESQVLQARHEVAKDTHTRIADAAVVGASASAAAMAKIQARAAHNEESGSSSEEEGLEVFSGTPEPETEAGEGTQKKTVEHAETLVGKKRKRTMDPWAGYDEPEAVEASGSTRTRSRV